MDKITTKKSKNMAATGHFVKCNLGVAKLNSGRLTPNVFLMLPLYVVHEFSLTCGIQDFTHLFDTLVLQGDYFLWWVFLAEV